MTDRRRLLAGAALLPLAGMRAAWSAERGERVRWPASPVALTDGRSWQAVPGQAVVIVFWSLHCGYCERHMAHIEKLHRASTGKPLNVLGVLAERDAEGARRRMQQRGWTFPLTMDRESIAAALTHRRSVPLTVTVDRQGRLQELIPGEMFEADVMGLLKLAG